MNDKTLRVLEFDAIKNMLMNLTQSPLGKEIANELQPSKDIHEVKKLLKETTQAVLALVKRGNPPLEGISDVRISIRKAELNGILSPGELLKIADVFRVTRMLKKYSSETRETQKLDVIDGLIDNLIINKDVEDKINNAIINDEEISDNASENLRNIRKQISNINNSIRDKLNEIITSKKYQKYLQDNIITIRDGRYVIPVKQEYRSYVQGLVHDSSTSGATLFIEPMSVVEANNKLKELSIQEKIEIEVILTKLTQLVIENIDILKNNLFTLGKLDFIFAKGKLSLEQNASEPDVSTDGHIKLIQARHPLIEPSRVVPIDIELGNGFNTLVITGPNTGGKTVSLKTVGLFVVMTQCGLHIPAKEGSKISIFSKIFADIGDEQSIEQSLSTFSSHMTNIVDILNEADSNSLCLFDELGAGTDPTEGSALAMSILNYLNKINAKTIATTHYSELKMFALSKEGFENASCEFDLETLKPTYRVIMGIPGKSNALEISRRLGLNEDIINKAKEYLSKEDIEFEDIISSLHKDKEAKEIELQKAQRYRSEVEALKQELEKQKNEIECKRQEILLKARQEALEILQQAKEESEEIIEKVRELVKEQQQQKREKALREAKQKLKSNIDKHEREIAKFTLGRTDEEDFPENVKIGQEVYVVNIGQYGVVQSNPDKNGDLQVQVGIMKINVNIKDLRIRERHKENTAKQSYDKILINKTKDISPEINVRKQYLDDALMNIDKYLDDAYLAGLNQVTIIHGKGEGILRNGIHEYLKKHPYVKSFRLGRYGEGEHGVTIVELKQ